MKKYYTFKKLSFIFSLAVAFVAKGAVQDSLDLQDLAQPDLVLETKQICIPNYPHAFNPSIIRWDNKFLMSFRVIPDPKQSFTSWIGLVWLDDNFNPIGEPQQLHLRKPGSTVPSRQEDGRLVAIGDRLFLVYTDNEDIVITRGGFRMYIAELQPDGVQFIPQNIERFSSFPGKDKKRREKNWVPFEYYRKLLFAYSLVPHKILYPLVSTGHCETFVSTESAISWNWGELRGGTPALLNGDHYLAFFHSSKKMKTVQSKDKEAMHYFMGAYTFKQHLPFTITQISKQPIIGNQVPNKLLAQNRFYTGAEYKPYWGSVMAVFPCGFIMDDQYIWVAYGRQDHEVWITKLDKKKLYESFIPVLPDPQSKR